MSTVIDYRFQDELTRKQIREQLRATMFVEAGAGPGKTRALVDRVVALVLAGTPVEKIAAITFTEKAAAELRDRVRLGLEEELPKVAPGSEQKTRIDAALESLDRAQVSTIHAFAQAILRTHAAEAGIDPDFGVQDEVRTQRRLQERWRAYLEHLADSPQAVSDVDRVLGLGLFTRDLETLAREISSRGELAQHLAEQPLSPSRTASWPDLERWRDELLTLPIHRVSSRDMLLARAEGLISLLEDLCQAKDADRETLLVAAAASVLAKNQTGALGNWPPGECDRAREVVSRVTVTLCETLAGIREQALANVLPLIVSFVREDERQRGRDGELTFDDLILGVRNVLQRNSVAAEALRNRFDALLIDEFQDTDPLQVDIALAFATDPANGNLEPGRLFLVGDPKQSIYRFRRADMAIYAQTQERLRGAGSLEPQLALNRRSRQMILDWVNGVFPGLIAENAGIQPPYRDIYPHRAEELAGPGVTWFGGPSDRYAREIRVLEAEELANACLAARDQGWEVAERDGAVRPAQFRDMAILIPRRTGLVSLERALAAARVPYRVEGGSLIYRTQEIRDLVNCLTAIDDPADEVAIVAALRSPAFACSDVDIARHKAAGGRFNYLHPDTETREGPVADALRVMHAYHQRRHDKSLAAFVEEFVGERGQVEIGVLDQGDRNSFRRMRFMTEQARAFESGGPESLRAFVMWLEHQSGVEFRDNEGAGVDDDEDAVRILTVHGAKGLEFPIVFLAGLSASPDTNRLPTFMVDHAGDRAAVYIGTKGDNRQFKLGDYDDLASGERAHIQAEFNRLLYVAATRARDHLVVSLYHKSAYKESAARRLIDAGACNLAEELVVTAPPSRAPLRPFTGLAVDLPDVVSGESFADVRRTLVEGSRHKTYTSATAIGKFGKDEATDESEPWARGRGGTRVGRAVHAAIQSLPLDADEATVRAFARAQAVAEAVPHREADVARLTGWVLRSSEAMQRARLARRALREVPFALEVDGAVLEGFVDLVIDTEDGLEIVDWKTDSISRDEVPDRLREYALQAGLYVYGLEAATGRTVSRITYVFANAAVESSPGDPATLRKAAEERLAASAAEPSP